MTSMARSKGIALSARIISACTMLSRVLGLVRDLLTANYFGASALYDAFAFAFRVPNLFRKLFGEGALTAAFIPAFSGARAEGGEEEAWRLFHVVFTFLSLLLVALALIGMFVCWALPAAGVLGERWELPLRLLRIMFPYMPLICLTAFFAAVLNCLNRFAVPAISPALLNVCWIGSILLVAARLGGRRGIVALAVGVLVAGLLQMLLQVAALKRERVRFRLSADYRHPGLRKVLLLSLIHI